MKFSSKIIMQMAALIIMLGAIPQSINAQFVADSITRDAKHWTKIVIAPSALICAGLIAMTDNEVFDRWEVEDERNKFTPNFRTHVDDYLQYAPIVAVYGLNVMGVKAKHDFANRTVLLIKSELIMTAIVYPLKKFSSEPRPDTGAPNSFPSGHTAQAFAAATFLHKEYGKDHLLYSILAYTTATGIGVLRVLNNRHWVSDVLVGAGVGILSTNIAYLTHQNRWGKHSKKLSGMTIMPTYGQRTLGMYLSIPVH